MDGRRKEELALMISTNVPVSDKYNPEDKVVIIPDMVRARVVGPNTEKDGCWIVEAHNGEENEMRVVEGIRLRSFDKVFSFLIRNSGPNIIV